VHPELCRIVPVYGRGLMEEEDDPELAPDADRSGAPLAPGAVTWSLGTHADVLERGSGGQVDDRPGGGNHLKVVGGQEQRSRPDRDDTRKARLPSLRA